MGNVNENLIDCSQFEDLLTDYLDKTLDGATQKAAAEHAIACPLCHSLLNDVRSSLDICRQMAETPNSAIVSLEARILAKTMPESAMGCEEFEEHLTDYLDGFLPASVFHRWERHAVLCNDCTDLPGTVVRMLAACVTYKLEELPVPEGLHERILQNTLGTRKAVEAKASAAARFGEWIRGFSFPISVPQLAPVAMLLLFAFIFSQTVSADGTLSGVYERGYQLAEQTYKQGSDALGREYAVDPVTVEQGGN